MTRAYDLNLTLRFYADNDDDAKKQANEMAKLACKVGVEKYFAVLMDEELRQVDEHTVYLNPHLPDDGHNEVEAGD